ncbi:MAG: 4Fe-4S binding protein [Candidatus Bathyarchaeia archaeon]
MPERIWRKPLDSEKAKPLKAEIHIIRDQCKGCGFCIQYCPQKVLEESNDINARGVHPPRVVNESKCVLCSFCTSVCPDFAIFVIEKKEREENVKHN